MLTRIRLRNFRLFEDTGDIALKPLTFLIGPNSGGKSTILKSLLLLKQSASSTDTSRPIEPVGYYCDLGRYKDFVYSGEVDNDIDIECDWIRLGPDNWNSANQIHPYLINCKVSWFFDHRGDQGSIAIKSHSLSQGNKKVIRARLSSEGKYVLVTDTSGSGEKQFSVDRLRGLCRMQGELIKKDWDEIGPEGLAEINYVETSFIEALERIRYVSSWRAKPERTSIMPETVPGEVGVRGERAGDLVAINSELRGPVSEWLGKLGIARGLSITMKGDSDYSIDVENRAGHRGNILYMGTGVPQALPVVVQGLSLPPGGVFLAEQPETDLNPSAQSNLGDFFAHVARDPGPGGERRQVIVETHSEHILSRLRTRIAEGKLDPAEVAVYYCALGEGGGSARALEISELGQFKDWPEGFFSEEINEAMRQTEAVFARQKGAGQSR